MTHFAHVGAHCAFPGCNQQDFLPFTCVRCQLVFCLDHRREEDHNCKGTAGVSRQVIICPICNLTIQKAPGEDENVTWLRHANTPGLCRPAAGGDNKNSSRRNSGGSQSPDGGGTNSNNKCVVCRKKLDAVNRFICPTCGAAVCTAHRFEDDHDCKQRQKDKAEQLRSARVGFFKKHAGAGSGRRARASSDGGAPTTSTSRPAPSVPIQQATTGSSLFSSSGAGSYASFDSFAPPQRTAAGGSTGSSTTTAGAAQFDAVGGRMVFENTTTAAPNHQQSQNISAAHGYLPPAQEMITKERSYRANGNPLSSVMRRNKSKEKQVPSNEPINCPQCTLTNPPGTEICIACGYDLTKQRGGNCVCM
ncbi:unnamed protein product [Amoebophrya sp. A120]|nr:unnamed protein product [Amoebophrya sp. A120]|eukprot:GSA120T00004458001.1